MPPGNASVVSFFCSVLPSIGVPSIGEPIIALLFRFYLNIQKKISFFIFTNEVLFFGFYRYTKTKHRPFFSNFTPNLFSFVVYFCVLFPLFFVCFSFFTIEKNSSLFSHFRPDSTCCTMNFNQEHESVKQVTTTIKHTYIQQVNATLCS